MVHGETGKLAQAVNDRESSVRVRFSRDIPDPVICLALSNRAGAHVSLQIVEADRTGFTFRVVPDSSIADQGPRQPERVEIDWFALSEGGHAFPDGRTMFAARPGKPGPAGLFAAANGSVPATLFDDSFVNPAPAGHRPRPPVAEEDALPAIETNAPVTVPPPCLTRDTRVQTPDGPRPVRELRPGDLVNTLDLGLQQVMQVDRLHLGRQDLLDDTALRPVLIRRGALGKGLPRRDLRVSGTQPVLISSPRLTRLHGASSVLIPALALVNGIDVVIADPHRGWSFYRLSLARPDMLLAEGCALECSSPETKTEPALRQRPRLDVATGRETWTRLHRRGPS